MIVIFDWDGTLCDSAQHIVKAMQSAAVELDIDVPVAAEVRNIIGLGLRDAISTLFPELPEDRWDELSGSYSRHYTAGDDSPPGLFPGAMETLEALRERGFELGVATGKSRRGLQRILEIMQLKDFFEVTRCADETRGKPHPLMLQEIMGERSKGVNEAFMVGDTEYDMEMAARAGIDRIGVSFGVHDSERLYRHAPLAVVDQLPELLGLPALNRVDL